MNATTIAVDLAKNVFQVAVADNNWKLIESHRLTRTQFERWFANRAVSLVIMEACGGTRLLTVSGIGLLTATALMAVTGGEVRHFKDARHFASWLGLTPKEYSSGSRRTLGRISKRGDRYRRMLLTYGARTILRAAAVARQAGRMLDGLRHWATEMQSRTPHNKAACAPINWRAPATQSCAMPPLTVSRNRGRPRN